MADDGSTAPALDSAKGFHWGQVPSIPGLEGPAAAPPEPDLGALANFTETFRGNGFNAIFRPQDFTVTPTPLPNPAHGPNDNILELNITEEFLSFSDVIGSIPNRGMVQGDIFLTGVGYLQTVNDVTYADRPPVGIHFEPGVWLNVPATTAPEEGATLVRMASIPHGTTIQAQGTSFAVSGGPSIKPVDITPFQIAPPHTPVRFPSQDVTDASTFRVPQDLTSFIASGAITQAILDNPNLILQTRADAQNITDTIVIDIDTSPAAPLFGGGTNNIPFLLGDSTATAPNADAVQMTATFWIEAVSEQITVPACGPGERVIVQGNTSAGNPVASFAVTSENGLTEDTGVDVTYIQIQYTQTVFLNFNTLTWPHVSVATLIPKDPVPVNV